MFAAAAARYAGGNPLLALERPETESLLPPLAGKDVLDLGAGKGYYAALATAQGARSSVALDITFEMLRGGHRPAVAADAAALPLRSGSFDVVIGALLLSFVSDLEEVLLEVARVLRSGGVVLLSDLHPVASARGWSRSFTGPSGERLVLNAPPPPLLRVEQALNAAGLGIAERREPVIDGRLADEFQRAGRKDFETLRGTPLLALFRASKASNHAG